MLSCFPQGFRGWCSGECVFPRQTGGSGVPQLSCPVHHWRDRYAIGYGVCVTVYFEVLHVSLPFSTIDQEIFAQEKIYLLN